MFTLYDNRNELYQWDMNRKVIVSDETIDEVHFCNKTEDCSLVTVPYRLADANILVADIPNILLQNDFPIRVYAYCNDGYTKIEEVFKVKTRTKPNDYIYEETEILRAYEILNRTEEALETVETTATELYEYVEDNKLAFSDDNNGNVVLKAVATEDESIDLSDYYTKAQTDSAINEAVSNIEIPETDLSSYVTTDTEQEITGAKTFTSPIKVTNSTNTATLSDRGVSFTDRSAPGVTLSNPINEYGLNIYLNGSGFITDGESRCLFFYDDDPSDYPTLGKKDAPWYRAYITNLSDGITTKSMTEVLSAPTMDEVTQAIQDALNGIATAEEGSY